LALDRLVHPWPRKSFLAVFARVLYNRATVTSKPYSAKQGQYLAFIFYYTKIHGVAPAKADMERYFEENTRKTGQPELSDLRDGIGARLRDSCSEIRCGRGW
jgi:hypothetical protein